MRLVKVRREFFDMCRDAGADPHNQLLHNKNGRPCVLIVKLRYQGELWPFVVPIKSNIPPNTDRKTFFALPPNHTTQPGNFHGIYYIKLFPIHMQYVERYRIAGDSRSILMKNIIDEHEHEIIDACQDYLNAYENGEKNTYTPEIDLILEMLSNQQD